MVHINQKVYEWLQDLRSLYITLILMLSNVFSWSEVSTLFPFNTCTLLSALSVLPGKGGWLYARLNLACEYSRLSLLLASRSFCKRDVYSRMTEMPYWWCTCKICAISGRVSWNQKESPKQRKSYEGQLYLQARIKQPYT